MSLNKHKYSKLRQLLSSGKQEKLPETPTTQLLSSTKYISIGSTMSNLDNGTPLDNKLQFTVFNRTVQIDADIKHILVEGDTNSRRLTFRLPRYFDGIDLTKKQIRIYFANAYNKTGYSPIENLSVNDDDFTIDWVVDGSATIKDGILTFQLEFYELNNKSEIIYRWQTTPTYINVEDTIEWFGNATSDDYFYQLRFIKNNPDNITYENLYSDTPPIEIINRKIETPILEKIVVERDTMSRALEFKTRRLWDGIDFAKSIIVFKYKNAANHGDRSRAINLKCDEKYVYFTWVIDGKVTEKEGRVTFGIEIMGHNERGEFYLWQTIPNHIFVEAGLLISEDMESPPPSWMQSWELEVDNISRQIENISSEIQSEALSEMSDKILQTVDEKYVNTDEYDSDTKLINQNFISLQNDINDIQKKLHCIIMGLKNHKIDGGTWDDLTDKPTENQHQHYYDGGTF